MLATEMLRRCQLCVQTLDKGLGGEADHYEAEPRVRQLTFFPCLTIISWIKGDLVYRFHQVHDSQKRQQTAQWAWRIPNSSQAELVSSRILLQESILDCS